MNEDITIDLKDLLYRVLLKWRILVAACVLGAILGDCVGILKDFRTVKAAAGVSVEEEEKALESAAEEKREALSDRELSEADAALLNYSLYRHEYDDLENYVDNSIYYSLDAQSVPAYTYNYMVKADLKAEYPIVAVKDHSKDLAVTFMSMAQDQEFLAQGAQLLGTGTEYVSELVDATAEEDADGAFMVRFYGKDREMCEKLAGAFDERINAKAQELKAEFGDYTLVKAGEGFSNVVNDDLKSRQQSVMNDMSSFRYNWVHVSDVLGEAQREYYDAMRELPEEKTAKEVGITTTAQAEKNETKAVAPTINFVHKKLILIGFVGMAFLVCFIIAMMYILMPVIRVKENITDGYGQPVLGTVWKTSENKAFLGGIDEWLTKLFYGRECSYDLKKRVNMLCAGLKIQIEKEGVESLFITGASDKNKDLVGGLQKGLEKSTQVSVGDSVVYDAKALEKLSKSKAVLFVETAGDSRYDEVAKELELAAQSKVQVLGFVLQQQR